MSERPKPLHAVSHDYPFVDGRLTIGGIAVDRSLRASARRRSTRTTAGC